MNDPLQIAIAALLVIGGGFILVGAIGLLKLDDPMKRLHAPTKASTLGVGSLLLASVLNGYALDRFNLNELLILAFLFVTAPISAHFIAKVNIHFRTCDTPPRPSEDSVWATQQRGDTDPNA